MTAAVAHKRIDFSKFRFGWVLINASGCAHYFVRKKAGIISDCGIRFTPDLRDDHGFVAFEPGTFPKCRRCEP